MKPYYVPIENFLELFNLMRELDLPTMSKTISLAVKILIQYCSEVENCTTLFINTL